MGETDYLHLSKTSGSDGNTLSFYNWRLLQDGEISSNTIKIDNWAIITGSALDTLEQLSTLVAPADAEYVVAGSSADLSNERIITSACGVVITQDSTSLTIKTNIIAGEGFSLYEDTSASSLSFSTTNDIFGISLAIGDSINPIIENTYKVIRAPYHFTPTGYNLFMDKTPNTSVTVIWQKWNGTGWSAPYQTITTSTQTTSGSYLPVQYEIFTNDIIRVICTVPANVCGMTLSFTIRKVL